MKAVIATNNPHKAGEILRITGELLARRGSAAPAAAGFPLEFRTLADFPGSPEVVENGSTLEENAVKKAVSAAAFTGLPALADDTGLEVYALGGAPGVLSARYAGPGCSCSENNKKLLAAMAGLAAAERGARFRCVMALVHPDGKTLKTEGVLEGFITAFPRGREGFGYDSVFEVSGRGKTLAELTSGEKNSLSHRALAVRAMLALMGACPT